MKKLIVPTDFSKLSHHAVDFACHLAHALKAEVAVLHFEEIPLNDTTLHPTGEANIAGNSEDSIYNAQLFRANQAKLNELVTEFSDLDVTVTGQQLGGGFLKGIKHHIDQHGGDLIILGTTGEESIQEFFTGNHTEQLIENLDIPVLSLQNQSDKQIHDIVLGLDLLDEQYSKKALEMVKILSDSLDARLHIISIVKSHKHDSLMSDLNKVAKIADFNNYVIDVIEEKNANEALLKYATDLDAGLIITLSKARSGLYRFFQHSFSTRLTKKSSIPVLTINKRQVITRIGED